MLSAVRDIDNLGERLAAIHLLLDSLASQTFGLKA